MFHQKNTTHEAQFVENREKIKHHFESQHLRELVKEFYTVQKQFHHNMGKLVNGFSQMTKELPAIDRYQLTKLLLPYKALTENPFGDYSGNIEVDIQHILTIVNRQNQQFHHMLAAMMTVISNLKMFSDFIENNKRDPQFIQRMIELMQCHTVLNVESMIYHPFQQIMRYELLLKEFSKEFKKEKALADDKLASTLAESLQFLTMEIENINANRESMYLLYRIERTLEHMLAAVITMETADEHMAHKMKEQIEFVIVSVKAGMKNIMLAKNDGGGFYEGLCVLLKDTEKLYADYTAPKTSSVTQWTGYAVSTTAYVLTLPISVPLRIFGLYPSTTNIATDLEELRGHIKTIEETLCQADSLLTIAQKSYATSQG